MYDIRPPIPIQTKISAIVQAYSAGASMTAIAGQLRVARSTIKRALSYAGVEFRPPIRRADLFAQIVADYQGGATYEILIKRYRTSTVAIGTALARAGVRTRPRGGHHINRSAKVAPKHCTIPAGSPRRCVVWDIPGSCDVCRADRFANVAPVSRLGSLETTGE